MNLKVGDKVIYGGNTATIIALKDPTHMWNIEIRYMYVDHLCCLYYTARKLIKTKIIEVF